MRVVVHIPWSDMMITRKWCSSQTIVVLPKSQLLSKLVSLIAKANDVQTKSLAQLNNNIQPMNEVMQ